MKNLFLFALCFFGTGLAFGQLTIDNTTGGPINLRVFSWDDTDCTGAILEGNFVVPAGISNISLTGSNVGAAVQFYNPSFTVQLGSETEPDMNAAGCPDNDDPSGHINWTDSENVKISP